MEKNPAINIVFFGTSEFALPSLSAILKHGYRIQGVVTNPDKPVGRRQILTPPPVKVFAQKHSLPIFQPSSLKIENWKLEIPEADLYTVAAYGKLIQKAILELPRYGALNIHPSLLPRWRGPSPIQYTILSGDTVSGVTIIKMDELMDNGPIVATRQLGTSNFKFQISKTTYQELHGHLAELGAQLLIETLPKYLQKKITPVPQDDSKATYSKILKKEDGRINWSKPAQEIERMVRAFTPWPGAWTLWPVDDKIYRLRIEGADVVEDESASGSPGYVWSNRKYPALVKTGSGSLLVTKITLEGRKSMSPGPFLAGRPVFIGATLI